MSRGWKIFWIVLAIIFITALVILTIYLVYRGSKPKPECKTNSDCTSPKRCISGKCINPAIQPSGGGTDRLTTTIGGISTLKPGQQLTNNGYTVQMRTDGTVVFKDPQKRNLWSKPVNMPDGTKPYNLTLTAAGELCIRDSSNPPNSYWCSTSSNIGVAPYSAEIGSLNNVGSFCVIDSLDTKLWCADLNNLGSNTLNSLSDPKLLTNQSLTNGDYTLTVLPNGNVTIIKDLHSTTPGTAIWSTNTINKGSAPYALIMGSDGNLCLYSNTNTIAGSGTGINPLNPGIMQWCSNTVGKGTGPYRAVLGADGSLQIIDSTGTSIWSSLQDNA
jgi:hypothetical protein